MSKWQGTPVPVSGMVEKVYINTSLSLDEVVSICDSLTFAEYNEGLAIWSCISDSTMETGIIISRIGTEGHEYLYGINYSLNGEQTPIFQTGASADNGWINLDTIPLNYVEFNMENCISAVGLSFNFTPENEKASMLFSITPFTKDVSLNSFLTGIADAIRSKKGTIDKINASNFASEIESIESGSTQEDLLEKSLNNTLEEYSNSNVTKVGEYGFYKKTALTEINLPNVVDIGQYAFEGCTALTEINLPNVVNIEQYAFEGCTALTEINLPNVTKANDGIFANCSSIKSINMPNLEVSFLKSFYNLTNLENVYMPKLKRGGVFTGGSVKDGSFLAYCEKLKSIDLPELYQVGGSAFYKCKALENVNLPLLKSVQEDTHDYLFSSCIALKSIKLPSLSELDCGYAFSSCYNLEKIELPLVTYIGGYHGNQFAHCYSLKKLIITQTKSVATLSKTSAFSNSRIKGYLEETYNPFGDADGYIYVPDELVENYKVATNWSALADNIRGLSMLNIYAEPNFRNKGFVTLAKNENNEIVATATANEGYVFNGWYNSLVKEKIRDEELTISDIDGATYNFVLNDNGYYESQNKGVGNSYAIGRFYFTLENDEELCVEYINSGESNYDYGLVGKVDSELTLSHSADPSTSVYKSFKGATSSAMKRLIIADITAGTHFIDVKFIKDSGTNSGNDSLQIKMFKVRKNITYGTLISNENTYNIGIEVTEENPVTLIAKFDETGE